MKTPDISRDRLRKAAPFAVPLVVLAAAWWFAVQPRIAASQRASAQIAALEPQVRQLARITGDSGTPAPAVSPPADLAQRLPAADPMPHVLERIARLALATTEHGGITDLLVETGERVDTSGSAASAPRVATTSQPDPRVALFEVPVAYTPVTVSFQASYARLGQFLWDLRGLPALSEVQSLDIRPVADSENIRVTLVLFAYRRGAFGGSGVREFGGSGLGIGDWGLGIRDSGAAL